MKKQRVIVLADCSDSMKGKAIYQVNKAIQNLNKEINNNLLIRKSTKLSVIAFSSNVKYIRNYSHQKLEISGMTALNLAYSKLYSILTTEKFEQPPILILLTDGFPNDFNAAYIEQDRLNSLKIFQNSIRLGVGYNIDSKSSKDILKKFTHDNKQVILTHSLRVVNKVISVITHKTIKKARNTKDRKVIIQVLAKDIKLLKKRI